MIARWLTKTTDEWNLTEKKTIFTCKISCVKLPLPSILKFWFQSFTKILELLWNQFEPSFLNLEPHFFSWGEATSSSPFPHFYVSTSNLHQSFGTYLKVIGTLVSKLATSPILRKIWFRANFTYRLSSYRAIDFKQMNFRKIK